MRAQGQDANETLNRSFSVHTNFEHLGQLHFTVSNAANSLVVPPLPKKNQATEYVPRTQILASS